MKITVFGTGYVGLVTGVCLAELGNEVCCVDIDENKIAMLKAGKSPIFERGMNELLTKNIAANRIFFTTDLHLGIKHGEYLFIAVGTPSALDGSANLDAVFTVAKIIAENIEQSCVVVIKSTVPVGTGDNVRAIITDGLKARGVNIDFDLVSNPEFLKQGDAIEDFMHSDRVIIGADSERAFVKMRLIYAPLKVLIVNMDVRSSELSKYAANAFLAARISFMNEIALLAEKLGADVENIRRGISTDPRVGPYFLHAGCGYGGSCFPKDVKALIKIAEDAGCQPDLFKAIEDINARQKRILVEKMEKHFQGDLCGKTVALWGLAFKPNTDDMREAPSRELLESLWQKGVKVQAYDLVAMNEARRIYGERDDLKLCSDAMSALENVDALVIVTEWDEFKKIDLTSLVAQLKSKVIFDGRNLYDPEKMKQMGVEYYCIGRNK